MEILVGIVALLAAFGGGWYCKGQFGAVVASDLTKTETAVDAVKKAL